MLSANRDEGFELLRLALTEPRFDAGRWSSSAAPRSIAGAQPGRRSGRPSVARRTLMATVFAGHPYATDADGLRDEPEDADGGTTSSSAARRAADRAAA